MTGAVLSKTETLIRIAWAAFDPLPLRFATEPLIGRAALAEHSGPRKVVWVPIGGKIAPPKRHFQRPTNQAGAELEHAQVTADRVERIQVWIFAESLLATETALELLVRAIKDSIPETDFAGEPYEWIHEREEFAGTALRGRCLRFGFDAHIPVIGTRQSLVIIEGEGHDAVFLNDDLSFKAEE